MKLIIEFGSMEMKHWPHPFAGVAPTLRCWFAETFDGPRVELPEVNQLTLVGGLRVLCAEEIVGAMRKSAWLGYPLSLRVHFGGGHYEAQAKDWRVLGDNVIEGGPVRYRPAVDPLLLSPVEAN